MNDATQLADQSTPLDQTPMNVPDHPKGNPWKLAKMESMAVDSLHRKEWHTPALDERILFWSSMYAKRNPVCDVVTLDSMEEYQVRNLIQSTFHSGTGLFLLEQELSNIMEVGNGLVLQNLRHEVRFVFQPCWDNFSGQHILGLPGLKFETWGDACTSFYLYLQSPQDDCSPLAKFRRRAAQIWFWLLFDIFCEESRQKGDLLGTTAGRDIDSTVAIEHRILAMAYPGYTFAPWGEARRRAMRNHLRLGFSWWRLACCLGRGVLLIASSKLARLLYVFTATDELSLTQTKGNLLEYRALGGRLDQLCSKCVPRSAWPVSSLLAGCDQLHVWEATRSGGTYQSTKMYCACGKGPHPHQIILFAMEVEPPRTPCHG